MQVTKNIYCRIVEVQRRYCESSMFHKSQTLCQQKEQPIKYVTIQRQHWLCT